MTVPVLPLWIGGKEVPSTSGRTGEVFDPSTGQVTRRAPFASAAEVGQAVAAAKEALPAWRDTPPLRRARVLARFRELLEASRDELAQLVTEEHGKTLPDAAGSVQRGIEVVEFASGAPHLLKGEWAEDVARGVDSHSVLQPVGVCAGITPFNFPAMVPLWMFPVAIACGNTFVLKPSEKVPSTALRMARIFQEAGLPAGVLNVVPGDAAAVEALLDHPDVSAVSFVGSTPVARHVHETAARNGKRVQALGGAKNHAVVLPDADLAFATDALIGAGYGSAGERCMAISVVVAVGDVAGPLTARLREKAAALKVGPGTQAGVEWGRSSPRPTASASAASSRPAWPRARSPSSTDGSCGFPAGRRASSSVRRSSTTSHRGCRSTGRRSSGRCWWWSGCARSTRPSTS